MLAKTGAILEVQRQKNTGNYVLTICLKIPNFTTMFFSVRFVPLLFLVLLFPFFVHAQRDYIITTKGDTLTGKVIRGNLRYSRVTLKNADGKQKINLREIREWKNGSKPVVVVPHTKGKRTLWYELLLVADGHDKLFRDLQYVRGHWIYYAENDGKYVQLTRENIDSQLMPKLSKCPAFALRYGQQTIRQSDLEDVFHYYNQHCGEY